MEIIKEKTGVVAELNGKFWGVQYSDGHCTENGFGDIADANISDPEFCTSPTDMTYDGSLDTEALSMSTLRKVKIKTIYTV